MPKPGWTTVSLRKERIEALIQMYHRDNKRPRTQKFGAWLDNYLYELTTYEELTAKYGHFIALENITDNHILLLDNIAEKHYFVKMNPKIIGLVCEQDESTQCVHVGFCLAIPQVYRALINAGYRTQEHIDNNPDEWHEIEDKGGIRQGYGYTSRKELQLRGLK